MTRPSFGDGRVCLFPTVGTTPFPRRRAPTLYVRRYQVCRVQRIVDFSLFAGVFTVCMPELEVRLHSGPAVYQQRYAG